MIYSNEEIELTLNFYSIAKLHIDNLNQALQFKELNNHEKNEYMFYSHIVSKVNYWLLIASYRDCNLIAISVILLICVDQNIDIFYHNCV